MKIPVEIATAIISGVVTIAKLIFRPKRKVKITKNKNKEVITYTDPETLDNTIQQPKIEK